ncbi:MAG TPA: hypothetical protein VMF56_08435, partial [Acidobacteriaceae bacterium]|nr:hypothetical protein [Acidobacteriaceae bacterium]
MGFAVLTFFAVFLLFVSGGLLLFYREAMLQRINAVVMPSEKRRDLHRVLQDSGVAMGDVFEKF